MRLMRTISPPAKTGRKMMSPSTGAARPEEGAARSGRRAVAQSSAGPLLLLLLTALTVAPIAQAPPAPGDPLPGLTPVEFELFSIGLEDFLEVEDAEEGLGPAYNGTSCGGCHNVPAVGGISPVARVASGHGRRERDLLGLRPGRRFPVPAVLHSHPRLSGGDSGRGERHRAPGADSRCSAPGSSRRFRTTRCWPSRTRSTSTANGVSGRAAVIEDRGDR